MPTAARKAVVAAVTKNGNCDYKTAVLDSYFVLAFPRSSVLARFGNQAMLLLQYSMAPRQADPNYPIGGDPARYSHFKRFLEAAFPNFSSLLAAAEAFASPPEQPPYTCTQLIQALRALTNPAAALVDMDLLTTDSPVTSKDASTLLVDWQSRIPALRDFWQAVQAHPGCFALLTAMTANQAKASLLSRDGVATLPAELVGERH